MTDTIETTGLRPAALAAILATAAMIVSLWLQGRLWWCKLGDRAVYINDAWNSAHTSQHFFDPYTFTHVLHGVLFFWIAGALLKSLEPAWRFASAIAAETAWEVLENSNYIIQQYRENTASLDYFGDSILNSVGDVVACAAGFAIAMRLGWMKSLLFFLLVEAILLIWIRDGLLLNILMLIYPLDAVKQWQISGI